MVRDPLNLVVLIGGNGSNLQALIDASQTHYRIAGVISHRKDVYGLERANKAGIATQVVDHQSYPTREDFEKSLAEAILHFDPQLIALAGFMRILSADFVAPFSGKIINTHPSLLPKYQGLNTHERVLASGESEHGASIHYVSDVLDGGPIIAQVKLKILPQDDPQTLKERVQKAEHWLYPQVVTWCATGRLKYDANVVTLDGTSLGPHGLQLTKE